MLRATSLLHLPYTLHNPYKHLSHAPRPVTLHFPSSTHTLVQVTSLNPNYLTLLLCLSILSRTQHEPLTKPECQDLMQQNTVYIVFTLGHAGPRIFRGPVKNPSPAPPRGAGPGIIVFSPRPILRLVPRISGAPFSQFSRAPFQLFPANSSFRVPGFCGTPPGAPLWRGNFAPGM